MNEPNMLVLAGFPDLLKQIKARIQQAQTRAVLLANAELVLLYWDVGRMIDQRQKQQGWGAAVIPRLAHELRNELPQVKGFSERNIDRMIAFYRAYPNATNFSPLAVAKLASPEKSPPAVAKLPASRKGRQPVAQSRDCLFWSVPWAHHQALLEMVKDPPIRLWYMEQTLANGWSRDVLRTMIKSEAHRRQGKAVTNFERVLPAPQSDLVQQTLKDPYIFDFLTLEEPFHERELETNLLHQLERFLLELGQGFAFVGRQVRLEVGNDDFYIDLLFYHLRLRLFLVIDLKKGEFKPEYAGKMNFYLGVVDDRLRHESDQPSIGLILCQDRNRIIAEYALRGVSKPIGVSQYELTRALPSNLTSALPTVEQIEAELAVSAKTHGTLAKAKKPKTAKATKPSTKDQPKKGRKK